MGCSLGFGSRFLDSGLRAFSMGMGYFAEKTTRTQATEMGRFGKGNTEGILSIFFSFHLLFSSFLAREDGLPCLFYPVPRPHEAGRDTQCISTKIRRKGVNASYRGLESWGIPKKNEAGDQIKSKCHCARARCSLPSPASAPTNRFPKKKKKRSINDPTPYSSPTQPPPPSPCPP